jgi:hypothetical protein
MIKKEVVSSYLIVALFNQKCAGAEFMLYKKKTSTI